MRGHCWCEVKTKLVCNNDWLMTAAVTVNGVGLIVYFELDFAWWVWRVGDGGGEKRVIYYCVLINNVKRM